MMRDGGKIMKDEGCSKELRRMRDEGENIEGGGMEERILKN